MNRRRTRRPRLLEDIGEWGWLEWLGRSLAGRRARAIVGFGDDAACLVAPSDPAKLPLVTTDVLIEGTHFTWRTATPSSLGEKAVAVNVSDIAAMGGKPTALVVGLGAPASFPIPRLKALFQSIERACRKWKIAFVGGDTVRSETLVLAPTLIGEFEGAAQNLPLRSRLRSGQNLYVTGTLGDSAAGLALLLSKDGGAQRSLALRHRRYLVERHRRPQPRLDEGRILTQHFADLAMIDLSDDLRTSIGLLSRASRVGMTIYLDRLPMSSSLRHYCRAMGREPLETAICGGEDYELLFATSAAPNTVRNVLRRAGIATPVHAIGCVKGRKVRWLNEQDRPVAVRWQRFEHFSPAAAQQDGLASRKGEYGG